MHVIKERQIEERLTPERLQAAAGIANPVAQQRIAHRVGPARGDHLDRGITTPQTLPGRHPHAGIAQQSQQRRRVGGVVLTVAVEGHDQRCPRRLYAGAQGGALPGGTLVANHPQVRQTGRLQHVRRVIARGVVDHDHLVGRQLQRVDLAHQRHNIIALVLSGDHKSHFGHKSGHILIEIPDATAIDNRHRCDYMRQGMDAIISGGGACGLLAAAALRHAGIACTVSESRSEADVVAGDALDRRNIALTAAALNMLRVLGYAEALQPHLQPIRDILVTDGTVTGGASPHYLHFAYEDMGREPGAFIENRRLLQVLRTDADVRYNCTVTGHLAGPRGITVTLNDRETVHTPLLLCAEGRESPTRRRAGIAALSLHYDHVALVTAVEHERPHEGLAHEFFLPGGPFAILPMPGNRSSLVWTERTADAHALLALPDADFDRELRRRFGTPYGEVRREAPVGSYPLRFLMAHRFTDDRLMLLGDSAHVVHPVAGQGFNLAVRDIAAAAELLHARARIGSDIGARSVLQAYQNARRRDTFAMAAATDLIVRLFSNDHPVLTALRRRGLTAVQSIPGLRRALMRRAAGIDGGAYGSLLRGVPLLA